MPNALRQAATKTTNVCVRFSPREVRELRRAARAAGARTISHFVQTVMLREVARAAAQRERKAAATRGGVAASIVRDVFAALPLKEA